jgi:hypothetical protein
MFFRDERHRASFRLRSSFVPLNVSLALPLGGPQRVAVATLLRSGFLVSADNVVNRFFNSI